VVVTVPLGALKPATRTIELVGVRPGLLDAISRAGYHAASKVMVTLSRIPWAGASGGEVLESGKIARGSCGDGNGHAEVTPRTDGDGCVRWGELVLCGDETSLAKQVWLRVSGGVCIATGFCSGPTDALACERLTDEQAADALVLQLRKMYGVGEELRWIECVKIDWGQDVWAGKGAYSSPATDACAVWRELRETGSKRLLLAGEAVHRRGSTVCSAIESGEWAADTIIEQFGRGAE